MGDIVMNFEPEIRRATKLSCKRCGVKGAALGSYYGPCLTSFHVPCAVQTMVCIFFSTNDQCNVLTSLFYMVGWLCAVP